ncbi:RecQ family ATP-dependent DNA helicase [Phaeobacter piscinae]|uniref:RecQ family ATP-dependent DNA helicase n=1 Tax=Phaeobacter piscinae TaxID=1580596 RepID=UPI00058B6F14|nr:RecQ family ATP-dependent DNA helicase [Phaeobacter piscinae]UTS82235.1 ATP-dependent RNA helicase RhlE [Phaeobacter piscinae]
MDKFFAEQLLKTALANPAASFRDGQWEAIDALVNRREKLLVVQRTGWGKSSVYFISTKIFRDQGFGPTIIVSPLLALMRNQIEAAERLGLVAATINSTNRSNWPSITRQVVSNVVDCLFVSPEQLAKDSFVDDVLSPISDRIALMVIDEAHCISDWGHDFRPDYRRIASILQQVPENTPVLATTATANNRVVNDIINQLGNIGIQRGPLSRAGLRLQSEVLPDQASRLAWLARVIPSLEGTGIVYTSTTRDAEQVAQWLRLKGIAAEAYHGSVESDEFEDSNTYRIHLEDLLMRNRIKVLVATSALGMGYDKPDLAFVFHYQAPGSVVSYYQQVGRAGRGVANSVGVLLSGEEDNQIQDFFRRAAFPPEQHVEDLLQALEDSDGMSTLELEARTNLSRGQIEKVLKLLRAENPSPVIKDANKWQRTPVRYVMDRDRISHLERQRQREWDEVGSYIATQSCKMEFLGKSLDDETVRPCGVCVSCTGVPVISPQIDQNMVHEAGVFLKHSEGVIKPRKRFVPGAFSEYGWSGNIAAALQASEGRFLSRWGDAGWGTTVAKAKHDNLFGDELVEAMSEMIKDRWQPKIDWVCSVPSLNHPTLVPEFAQKLANRLGLPFVDVVTKAKVNAPQKEQQNSFHQCRNLDGVFHVSPEIPAGDVLLVDDVIDSGWTFTTIAALLRQAGCGQVYPAALASSSVSS